MKPKYAVVIEQGETSFGAYVPDLPGCVAVGSSREEVELLIAEAIALHLESLRQHGEPVPAPTTRCEYVEPLARAS
jgi:predicted RNase H-like HicB family nuclease